MGDSLDDAHSHRGKAVVFWSWIVVLYGGLAIMLAVPLTGR